MINMAEPPKNGSWCAVARKALAAPAISCARAEPDLSIGSLVVKCDHRWPTQKKAGVVEHPEVFDHAGLLVNGPAGKAGLPFV